MAAKGNITMAIAAPIETSLASPTFDAMRPTRNPCVSTAHAPMNVKNNPLAEGVQPNLAWLKRGNVEGRPENERFSTARVRRNDLSSGRRKTSIMALTGLTRRFRPSAVTGPGRRNSLMAKNPNSAFPSAMPLAANAGIRRPRDPRNPPSRGPAATPNPTAAPARPSQRVRSEGPEPSVI